MADPNDNEKRLPWPEETDPEKLGEAFADPNSKDDRRVGRNFEETNFSGKKHKQPLAERIHKPASRRPLYIGLAVFAVIFLLVVLVGGLPKFFRNREINERADRQKKAKPIVQVARVERAKEQAGLALPGTTIPLNEAFVYARASGYLQTLKVDIGDHVRKGQLLAVIDAPDLDAQVDQARQQVKQAEQQLEQQKSQLALATVTVQRYRVLVTKGVFSRQQGDQEEATYASSLANVAAAQRNVEAFRANLARQIALQGYEQVRAPFDGLITQRNADIGALISAGGASSGAAPSVAPQGQTSSAGGSQQAGASNNAGSSGSTSTAATSAQTPGQGGPLFAVSQLQRLRVLVSVPEGYAPFIHVGQHATLNFQEYASRPFDGVITRSSGSVDTNTRTMLTEVQIDNHDSKLVSGMYVVVTFPPAAGINAPLVVKGDAVAIRDDQTSLAVVENGKVHIVPVILGRDFGDVIEIMSGVKAGDLVVTDVTDEVVENAEVQINMDKSADESQKTLPQNRPPGGSTRYSSDAITDRNVQGQQQNQDQLSSGQGKNASQNAAKSESKP